MKIVVIASIALAVALPLASAEEKKTLGEKTSDALKKTGEVAKDAGEAVVAGAKKAGDAVVDAVTPDKDAHKVDVKLSEGSIDMPKSVGPGKTAFVVTNSGKGKHNFHITGEGIDKKFLLSVPPGDTKILHADLKPGTYKISCPMEGHEGKGMMLNLTVK